MLCPPYELISLFFNQNRSEALLKDSLSCTLWNLPWCTAISKESVLAYFCDIILTRFILG
jgi:hypothetical protein